MEGMGSRLGRTSSRYGLSASATIFNGPVRKWKRKWVHVSPSPTLNYRSNNHSNGHNDQNINGSRLLLCRWTPLSPAAATTTITEDPPKRKFRYTPIAVLKEHSKAEKKAEQEAEKQLIGWQTSNNDEQNVEDDFKSENQEILVQLLTSPHLGIMKLLLRGKRQISLFGMLHQANPLSLLISSFSMTCRRLLLGMCLLHHQFYYRATTSIELKVKGYCCRPNHCLVLEKVITLVKD